MTRPFAGSYFLPVEALGTSGFGRNAFWQEPLPASRGRHGGDLADDLQRANVMVAIDRAGMTNVLSAATETDSVRSLVPEVR